MGEKGSERLVHHDQASSYNHILCSHRCDSQMSGVEAAGFVLAAFPLLISALEHYRESAEVLKDWWRFKREYRKVKVGKIPRSILSQNLILIRPN